MCPETFQVAAGLAVHQPSCPMTCSPGPARTGAQLVPQCPSAAPPRLPQEAGARCAELEAAAARLAGELADFKAESRQLRNQDLTIRRLEERARALEAELAAKARCPRRPPATPRLPQLSHPPTDPASQRCVHSLGGMAVLAETVQRELFALRRRARIAATVMTRIGQG